MISNKTIIGQNCPDNLKTIQVSRSKAVSQQTRNHHFSFEWLYSWNISRNLLGYFWVARGSLITLQWNDDVDQAASRQLQLLHLFTNLILSRTCWLEMDKRWIRSEESWVQKKKTTNKPCTFWWQHETVRWSGTQCDIVKQNHESAHGIHIDISRWSKLMWNLFRFISHSKWFMSRDYQCSKSNEAILFAENVIWDWIGVVPSLCRFCGLKRPNDKELFCF